MNDTPRTQAAEKVRRLRRSFSPGLGGLLALGFVGICAVTSVLVPSLPLADPNAQDIGRALVPPSAENRLGTDQLGRDLLSRLLWGTRTSMLAAFTAVAVAAAIGVPLGLVAGYFRGWVDAVTGRVADMFLTVPALILLLMVQTALQTGIQGQMVTLGVILAPRVHRIVRAETVGLAHQPFMVAGRMSGCSHLRIVWRYLLPGVRAQAMVQVSYLLGLSLVIEAGISFLGIGVRPPDASLGTLLTGAAAMLSSEPRVVLIPAAVLTALILSLNLLGDAATKESEYE
ncbi:ABC transporter permease [Spinactinospora alkalitolerans]